MNVEKSEYKKLSVQEFIRAVRQEWAAQAKCKIPNSSVWVHHAGSEYRKRTEHDEGLRHCSLDEFYAVRGPEIITCVEPTFWGDSSEVIKELGLSGPPPGTELRTDWSSR